MRNCSIFHLLIIYLHSNEYHLLALATFLNTDIFIYSSFYNTQSGEIYQIANNTIELQQTFDQNNRTNLQTNFK